MDDHEEVKQSNSPSPELPAPVLAAPTIAPIPELPRLLVAKVQAASPRQSPRPPTAGIKDIRPMRVPMPTPSKPKAETPEAIVEQWFRAHFHNTVWTGNSQIYNKLHEAKQDLIRRLRKEV